MTPFSIPAVSRHTFYVFHSRSPSDKSDSQSQPGLSTSAVKLSSRSILLTDAYAQ
jgi:hypothetical protein